MIGEVHQIEHVESRRKFAGEENRVMRPDAERNERPGIAENRMDDIRVELLEMLVCEHKPNPVFPELRNHAGDAQGREGLELVHIEEEGETLFFRYIGPAESREPDSRYEQAAEKCRAVVTDLAARQIDDDDLSLVHQAPEAEHLLRLGQDTPKRRIGEKSADLVLNRRGGIRPIAPGILLELFLPEVTHRLIGERARDLLPIGLVVQHAQDIVELRMTMFEKRKEDIAEHMLHADAPGIRPVLLQSFHQA